MSRMRSLIGVWSGVAAAVIAFGSAEASDWARFRGPNGLGVSPDKAPPSEWSDTENLRWRSELPGPGSSCPIVVGEKVLVTSWSGYGLDRGDPGDQEDLKRHLVCVDRKSGKTLWSQTIDAVLPEDPYRGNFTQHGYASHSPTSDGERVYVFFGKTGALAFDLDGKKLWQTRVGSGSGMRGWGTASSPIVYEDLLIVTASAESEALVGLDTETGKEVWRTEAEGFQGTWGTPVLVDAGDGRTDIVLGVPYEIWGFDPRNGKLRWYSDGVDSDSICASLIAYDGKVFGLGARGGSSIAVRGGGKGDVTETNVIWRGNEESRISTPLVYDGRIYSVSGSVATCVDLGTGKRLYQGRLTKDDSSAASGGDRSDGDGARERGRRGRGGFGGQDYSSPVAAGGKIYFIARSGDGYVLEAGPEFRQIAHNKLRDGGEFSATPAISNGALFVRSSKYLYCVAASE